jgi:hypothetical protein
MATLAIETPSAHAPRISLGGNSHAVTVQEVAATGDGWRAKLRVGVVPGRTMLRVEVPGAPPAEAELTTTLDSGDSAGDGTPDFLRLDDPQDQTAFRRWFTFLAEAQYFRKPSLRPVEISDCAALTRYAYREALRAHDRAWAAEAQLPLLPALESVARYRYPYTALGAALFRVREGPFRPSDLDDGAFAQFADAETLRRLNTHFVSRDAARALPGDLLFFQQESNHMPFHSMIYLGESQFAKDGARYVVYHTGPDSGGPGEIRSCCASRTRGGGP